MDLDVALLEILFGKIVRQGGSGRIFPEHFPEQGVAFHSRVDPLQGVQQVFPAKLSLRGVRMRLDRQPRILSGEPGDSFAESYILVPAGQADERHAMRSCLLKAQFECVDRADGSYETGVYVHHSDGSDVKMAVDRVALRISGHPLLGVVCRKSQTGTPYERRGAIFSQHAVDRHGKSRVPVAATAVSVVVILVVEALRG